jgi:hypothetical protein
MFTGQLSNIIPSFQSSLPIRVRVESFVEWHMFTSRSERTTNMKQSKLIFLLCALVLTGIAVSSINCMFPGTMNGNVGVNISDQPVWGPEGYDRADYYYIPDIDSYYSVSEHQYIYRDGSAWTHGATLPSRYSNYDPYHSYKVVINENNPYQNHDSHQVKYGTFKGKKDQPVIRDSRDPKYFGIKDHPQHDKWVKQQQQH